MRLVGGVAPSDVLNIVNRKSDDVSKFLVPAIFIKQRLIVTLLTRVAMDPSILG